MHKSNDDLDKFVSRMFKFGFAWIIVSVLLGLTLFGVVIWAIIYGVNQIG